MDWLIFLAIAGPLTALWLYARWRWPPGPYDGIDGLCLLMERESTDLRRWYLEQEAIRFDRETQHLAYQARRARLRARLIRAVRSCTRRYLSTGGE